MDEKTITFVLNAIDSLRKDQKILANKVIELNEVFKNSITKIKKKQSDETSMNEAKMKDFDGVLNIHEEGIANLQFEKSILDDLMKQIDDNINNVNQKIDASMKRIEQIKKEEKETDIKQCIYDRKGYCKEEENCKFFHAQEICREYIENKICTIKSCRKRHPQHCRYFYGSICRRGDSCRYLHDNKRKRSQSCTRCEKPCLNKYYCEFCKKSFCSSCTIEEAHLNNIFDGNVDSVCCSNIHLSRLWVGPP